MELPKRKTKKIVTKKVAINLTEEMKAHSKNNKTLMKENLNPWKNGKDILCSWIWRINISRFSISPPKKINRFKSNPVKIPMRFFIEIEKEIHTSDGTTKDSN